MSGCSELEGKKPHGVAPEGPIQRDRTGSRKNGMARLRRDRQGTGVSWDWATPASAPGTLRARAPLRGAGHSTHSPPPSLVPQLGNSATAGQMQPRWGVPGRARHRNCRLLAPSPCVCDQCDTFRKTSVTPLGGQAGDVRQNYTLMLFDPAAPLRRRVRGWVPVSTSRSGGSVPSMGPAALRPSAGQRPRAAHTPRCAVPAGSTRGTGSQEK